MSTPDAPSTPEFGIWCNPEIETHESAFYGLLFGLPIVLAVATFSAVIYLEWRSCKFQRTRGWVIYIRGRCDDYAINVVGIVFCVVGLIASGLSLIGQPWTQIVDYCKWVAVEEHIVSIDVTHGNCDVVDCSCTAYPVTNNCTDLVNSRISEPCVHESCCVWDWNGVEQVCVLTGAAVCSVECDNNWSATLTTGATYPQDLADFYDVATESETNFLFFERHKTGCNTASECVDYFVNNFGEVGDPFDGFLTGPLATATVLDTPSSYPDTPFNGTAITVFCLYSALLATLAAVWILSLIRCCKYGPSCRQLCCCLDKEGRDVYGRTPPPKPKEPKERKEPKGSGIQLSNV
ncbi:hypothetical protein OAM67_00615 [bacterium]|nr:hypothetical protein [bacterium]